MKHIIYSITMLIVFFTSSLAHATILDKLPPRLQIYAGGKLGYNQQFIKDGNFNTGYARTLSFSNDSPSFGLAATGGVSYEIIPRLFIRGELEYMYRIPTKFDAEDVGIMKARVETQIHTILINSYVDYYLLPRVSIYATLGMGVAIINARGYNIPNVRKLGDSSSFAIQVGFGAGYKITDNWIVDASFRYLDVMSYSSSRAKLPLSAVELIAGVRYVF